MKAGILGRKIGMTQLFTAEGKFVPVTVVEAGPCRVISVSEGRALLGYGNKKEKNTPRPQLSVFKRLNMQPPAFIKEVEFEGTEEIRPGGEITVDIFKESDFVDITGTTKGKGFQGGVKRWHWRGGPDSHGSMHHRRVGSVGASSFPSRVLKGQRLPGRMGNERHTVQNLQVIKVDRGRNVLLVKGAVPGPRGGYLIVRFAKKRKIERVPEKQETKKKESSK